LRVDRERQRGAAARDEAVDALEGGGGRRAAGLDRVLLLAVALRARDVAAGSGRVAREDARRERHRRNRREQRRGEDQCISDGHECCGARCEGGQGAAGVCAEKTTWQRRSNVQRTASEPRTFAGVSGLRSTPFT